MAAKVKSYEEYDYERLCEYAGLDNIVTSDLLVALWPDVKRSLNYKWSKEGVVTNIHTPTILDEALNVKSPALEFMVDMEVNGFLYDQALNREFDRNMLADVMVHEDAVFHALKRKPGSINLDSTKELTKLLYEDMKLTSSITTPRGEPAVSGDAIKEMYEESKIEWLNDLRIRNDIKRIHSSFISTYIGDWVKRDGRIHPSYNLHGTSSHRISSDNPNLLNLPNPVHGYNIRRCYIVPVGHVFVTFDFSSCEVKILAALCRDEKMLVAIHQGLDFHSYTAATINGITYDEFVEVLKDKTNPLAKKYKKLRQNAKAVTFGILYGSSLFGIALGLGITQDEAKDLVDLYFETFPRIKDFVEDQHQMAKLNQMVFSPFGQRKREFGTYDCFKRTAVYNAALRNSQNVQIQGPASTLGLMSFAELNTRNKLLGARSLATVYDSIEIESPMKSVARVIENGFACMDDWPQETFDWLDFPIGADAEIGFNWGEVVDVHRGETQEQIEAKLRELDPRKFEECLEYSK